MSPVSFSEKIYAHIVYWKNFIGMIKLMQKIYKKSYKILFSLLKNNFPINVELKNGEKYQLRTYHEMDFLMHAQQISNLTFNIRKDEIIIENQFSKNKLITLIFYGGMNNGDIINGVLGDDYSEIDVKNKIVIDIGANIGDTAIYFISKGAKNVIGVEPFPKNFNLAKKNILKNKMQENIKLIQSGCSSKSGFIKIDAEKCDTISTMQENQKGIKIPIITIEQIIKENNVPKNSILKIDCEGCEYEIIKSMSKDNFKNFSEIFIEYHYGHKQLTEILRENNFNIKIQKPIATNVINFILSIFTYQEINKIGYVGFIHAKKIIE
tara:strand:- start:1003 stop:1971 length:969 start_codon:yes stop_codon:yes gene_type:complete